MLDYSILKPDGILLLKPGAALTQEDFAGLGAAVDAYLAAHDRLHGVLVHARQFPGWENISSFAAHLQFVRDHHQRVDRIAVVTDSAIAGAIESIGKYFISAEVRRFEFDEYAKAMEWLKRD